jgi:hypothetical protein
MGSFLNGLGEVRYIKKIILLFKDTLNNITMFEQIILNLTIIGKIPKGGRIRMDSYGNISLESESSTQPFLRWFWSRSRDRNMRDIKKVKDDAFEKTGDIMENKFLNIFKHTNKPAESELEEHSKRVDQLNTLATALTQSLKGIENLRETYAADATTVSILGIMYNEIEEKVISIKSKVESAHYIYMKRISDDCNSNNDETDD